MNGQQLRLGATPVAQAGVSDWVGLGIYTKDATDIAWAGYARVPEDQKGICRCFVMAALYNHDFAIAISIQGFLLSTCIGKNETHHGTN